MPLDKGHHAPARTRAPRSAGREQLLRQYEILMNVSRRVSGSEALEEILDTLVELTSHALEADRSSFFLYDPATDELFSRTAQGVRRREIRISRSDGIAGAVFCSQMEIITDDAYADTRFDPSVDQATGYVTKTLLCVPIRTVSGDVIGVAQCLNKQDGKSFSAQDSRMLTEIAQIAVPALRSSQFVEKIRKSSEQERDFLGLVADITSELGLDTLLARVMSEVTRMLDAERSTLFLHDAKTGTLFSRIAQGATIGEIRLPSNQGIAGAVYTSGQAVNIPYAYADLRFNPAFDRQTGYFTRSILCTPVLNKQGRTIGVTQVLNKRGGPFTEDDEQRLKAFTAQIAIALENAKLFDDVQRMKNYNDSMLHSMSNGVVTLNEDNEIVTCNDAGLRILQCGTDDVVGRKADAVFAGANQFVLDGIAKVAVEGRPFLQFDVPLSVGAPHAADQSKAGTSSSGQTASVNLTILPLTADENQTLGTMLMMEDISTEKRVKATMSRYMDPTIAARMMDDEGSGLLGGQNTRATVMFTDIRGFTPITEQLGPQGTVSFLNEYFSMMVEAISKEEGMLDKFIGDAIMAAFGLPVPHDDDEDRAVRAAIAMIRQCWAYSDGRVAKGQLPVDMGIGLNTDLVVSGNIGSARRMDYTLIGDGVNLASRLESACKQYSAHILISEGTFSRLRGTYRIRDVDIVIVKGKTQPVPIYEVLDYHTPETFPNVMDVVSYFNDGIIRYRDRKFQEAISCFEISLHRNRMDHLSQIYIDRCLHFLSEPPPEDWVGVWTMKEK